MDCFADTTDMVRAIRTIKAPPNFTIYLLIINHIKSQTDITIIQKCKQQLFYFHTLVYLLVRLQLYQIIVIMGQLLIQQGTLFHNILSNKFKCNEERVNQIKNFAVSITELLGGFSSEITNSCRRYFKKLKIDEQQDQSIIFMSKYIIDILNQLAKKITTINKKIQLDVIDPLNQFSENQIHNHISTLTHSEQMLYSIQTNNELLKQLNRNFQINECSLIKSQQQKQILHNIVESQIDKCNHKWQQVKKQYLNILLQIDSYNSLRCNFTLRMQITIVQLLNRLVNSDSVEDSLQQYAQISCENQTISIEVKDQMRDKLGKLIIFEEMGQTDLYDLISSQVDQKEKYLIDDFIGFFTSRSNLKEHDKNYEDSRGLILDDMRWTNYFLNRLKGTLHTQIKLNSLKYRQMATIIKYIFAIVVQVEDNQCILYNLLYISYRIRYNDQYLIKQLGKHEDFWKNIKLWQNIIMYIKSKFNRKGNQDLEPKRYRLKNLFNKQAWASSRASVQKRLKNQKINQNAKIYDILCEVNYYMAKLQLQQHFIFEFMLAQGKYYDLSKQITRKLLQFHYMNKIILTNKVSSNSTKRKQRIEEKYKIAKSKQQKLIICVGKCLKFLPANSQLISLLLVSKLWNENLNKKIIKRYLIHQKNHNLVNSLRLNMYKYICRPPFTKAVYLRMIQEVPEQTEHSQIIYLDARRSLGWDQKLRVKMIQILKAFSYYHTDNAYLQGMNYLCQNLLKLTDDTYICYSIFQHLMNNQYYGLYTGTFDGLKIKIYQFMRIVERERPELYQHLKAQKLQGQHFLLPWAITLWGEMSGQLSWVMWDGFILQGWHWWFKTSLWLLKVLEPELLKMNFEDIMKCFSDLHSSLFSYSLSQLSQYGIDQLTIKKDIDSIHIQKEVLVEIEKEYKMRTNMISEYLKNNYNRRK